MRILEEHTANKNSHTESSNFKMRRALAAYRIWGRKTPANLGVGTLKFPAGTLASKNLEILLAKLLELRVLPSVMFRRAMAAHRNPHLQGKTLADLEV